MKTIIIGAGPAGLTCAYELCKKGHTDVHVIEQKNFLGGITTSFNFDGNIVDMGGHRFLSKNKDVLRFWNEILPIQKDTSTDKEEENIMFLIKRISNIFYKDNFFKYPLEMNLDVLKKFGFIEAVRTGLSYVYNSLFFSSKIETLEQFMVKNFGRRLYNNFFKPYTIKVWGEDPSDIPAEWAVQRIKKVSIKEIVFNFFKKSEETSLSDIFYYPKYGAIQLWTETARKVEEMGGKIYLEHDVSEIEHDGEKITAVKAIHNGKEVEFKADVCVTSMPMDNLIKSMNKKNTVPNKINKIAEGLVFRHWAGVSLIIDKKDNGFLSSKKDHWIYIEEEKYKAARLEIFNNWSPYIVADYENTVSVMLEYFINEGDDLSKLSDDSFCEFAIQEMLDAGFIDNKESVKKSKIFHVKKAYPAYFGETYSQFNELQSYINTISNLYPVGRNGMHRYNNSDHSVLCAVMAVRYMTGELKDKSLMWDLDIQSEFDENNKSVNKDN